LTPAIIEEHLKGHLTVGSYTLSENDTCIWGAFDFDVGSKKTVMKLSKEEIAKELQKSLETVVKLRQYLLAKYNIESYPEFSGWKGFHLWIFCQTTSAATLRRFMEKAAREAEVGVTEIFPKQSEKEEFGNLVKVPFCVHQISKQRSYFLNPDTREPLSTEDGIKMLSTIQPCQIPSLNGNQSEEPGKGKKAGDGNASKGGRHLSEVFPELRPCFKMCFIHQWKLTNNSGHAFNLAILRELASKNASQDACLNFFKNLPEYREDKARDAIERNLRKNVRPFRCPTILEKCAGLTELVKTCKDCEHNHAGSRGKPCKKLPREKKTLPLPPIPFETIDPRPCDFDELLKTFRKWLYIRDEYDVSSSQCAFLSNFFPGDPDIIGLIQPSGSDKTEKLRCYGETENQYCYPLSSITEHTLISGHKDNVDTVSLIRGRAIVIKDLTSILSKKEEARSAIFSQFREITDGYLRDEWGNTVKKEYTGLHFTIVFGSTNAIERYYSMYSNLGQRMVFMRPENDRVKAREKSEDNRGKKDEMRKELHAVTMRFVKTVLDRLQTEPIPEIPQEIKDRIGNLCDFLGTARTQIHHDFKGFIDELPEIEFPTRINSTICKLMEVHAFIHRRKVADKDDQSFVTKVLRDNLPTTRMRVMENMIMGDEPCWGTSSEIGNRAKLPIETTKRILEELTALSLIEKLAREDKGEGEDRRSDSFRLTVSTAAALRELMLDTNSPCEQNKDGCDLLSLVGHVRDEIIAQMPHFPRGVNENLVLAQAYRWNGTTEEHVKAVIDRLIQTGDIQSTAQNDIRYLRWNV
jgi:hypothetical protein